MFVYCMVCEHAQKHKVAAEGIFFKQANYVEQWILKRLDSWQPNFTDIVMVRSPSVQIRHLYLKSSVSIAADQTYRDHKRSVHIVMWLRCRHAFGIAASQKTVEGL